MEPGADTVYVAWRLEGEADERQRICRSRCSPTAATIMARPGRRVFRRRSLSKARALTMTAPNRFELQIAATGGADCAAPATGIAISICRSSASAASARATRISMSAISPCLWRRGNGPGSPRASTPQTSPDLGAALERRRAHDRAVLERAVAADPVFAAAPGWVMRLVLATDAFVIARPLPDLPEGRSVIAGYPWFGDWGRDTMISLPGLCLATGRFETARLILETFARFVDRGMLPNVFPGAGATPEYNTADASLWFVEAWRAYVEATGDEAALAPDLSGAGRHHRLAPQRHALRHRRRSRGWPAARRRTRHAADLDGCEGRRLGGDAAHRQAGRDQRALVQRAGRDGRRWPGAIGAPAASYRAGGGQGAAGLRAIRAAGRQRSLRCGRRPGRPRRRACGRTRYLPSACRRACSTRRCSAPCVDVAAVRSSPPTACARWRRKSPATAAPAAAPSPIATAPIIRARCGPGCWALGAGALPGLWRRRGGAALSASRSAIICAMPGSARSARSSTATRRTRRAAARRRPGRSPACSKPGGVSNTPNPRAGELGSAHALLNLASRARCGSLAP